jgi:TolB-like protein/DNA-binding winged helix-turn-helix (wHTH) protein/Tfp pilus assembly protein PilF
LLAPKTEISIVSYCFLDFELDPGRYELRRKGRNVPLEKIPMDLLILLLEKKGDVVSREEIIERIWGKDVFVDSEAGVNTAIRKIRQSLHDDPENPRFIQTLVGRGYRFLPPIKVVKEPPRDLNDVSTNDLASRKAVSQELPLPHPWVIWAVAFVLGVSVLVFLAANVRGSRDWLLGWSRPAPIRSLAVLPIENLSRDPGEEYFTDGITDELITDLAQIGELRVISRTSVMRFKGTRKPLPEIARELNVDAVVEGTVERYGDHVRVRAQLIRAADDRHLWAETFEREPQDILALQSEVASAIARQVQVKLVPGPRGGVRPVKPAVYEEYLKGRFAWNKRSEAALQEGIEHFQQAIAIDPNYAAAYSGLADSYTTMGYLSYIAPKEAFSQARAAALKALELDGTLAEPHASLAYVRFYHDWDWPGAEAEFKQAIALNPNYATAHDWYSYYLTAMGRPEEALGEIRRAQEIDPLSLVISTDMGFQLFYKRRYDEAILQLRKTLEMNPKFPLAHLWLGRAYQQKEMYEEAIAEYSETDAALPGWVVTLAGIGNVEGMAGKKREARDMLARLNTLSQKKYVTPYGVALVYAGLGEKNQALNWLDKALDDRSHWLVWMRLDPRWDPIRDEPRFKRIVGRVGFPG